jgi:5-methylcytosine-specific restriction endonuclease McrA
MPRAKKRCGLKCPNPVFRYGKCKEHQPERIPWVKTESSPDRSYLKTQEWERQKRRVLYRDNTYNGGCQGHYVDDCTGIAAEVDHIAPVWYVGVDEVDDNDLQGLCKPCHGHKSSRDGYFAKLKKHGKI